MSETLFVHEVQSVKYLYGDIPGSLFAQFAIILKVSAQIAVLAIFRGNEKRARSFVPTIELDEAIRILCYR